MQIEAQNVYNWFKEENTSFRELDTTMYSENIDEESQIIRNQIDFYDLTQFTNIIQIYD